MTVTYSAEVATSKGFGCFWKLLFRWRGSIYKLLWPELFLYVTIYYLLSIIYRFALGDYQRRYFEKVSIYCKTYGDLIPVSFILGFYVSIVVKRWWDSFNCIPWPDTMAFFVSAYIHGQDDRGRLMRRSIMRYANLAFVITLTCISPCVKKRFPTMDHLVEAGILLPNEKKVMEQLKTSHSMYWMPLVWASSIAIRARKEGRIRDDFALNTLVEAIASYRSLCGGLFNYDWISIPLVYTQVVTLVVYTFFLASLLGRQYLDPTQKHPGYEVDLYVPIFNFLQFFFYMGWLKVAETLVNPFGEDDDDFEVNWVIDRDIQVSYLIVDEMHQEHPELIKDQYWDEVLPDLPYTAASMPFYSEPPMGSAANLVIPPHEAEFVPLEPVNEDEDELEDIKVDGIPLNASHARNRLNKNLSGSSFSGISKLGRSFRPSYERKGILNYMQDFLSRESSVRSKKKLYKVRSKDGSTREPSPSCDTSCPPTPEDSRERMKFNEDIFKLSDLSLSDSRGSGVGQSPGYYQTMQIEDFFGRMRPERSHRLNLSAEESPPKLPTPINAGIEDKRDLSIEKKEPSSSFKNFLHSNKHNGSQKSLFSNLRKDSSSSRNNPSQHDEETQKYVDERNNTNLEEDFAYNSDEEITIREAVSTKQNISKSNVDIGHNARASAPIPVKSPRKSMPNVYGISSEKEGFSKMMKDPSTSTLVDEGSLGGTPPKSSKEKTALEEDKNYSDDTDISSIHSPPSPTKSPKMSLLQRKLLAKSKRKRTHSLQLSERQRNELADVSHLKKIYQHKGQRYLCTMSQPVSPTESSSGFFSGRSFFGRRGSSTSSKGKKSSADQTTESAQFVCMQNPVENKHSKMDPPCDV